MFYMYTYMSQVHVGSPILMRMLASRHAIAQSVAKAGVAGEVNVVASWTPCRLLVWSPDRTRGADMEKVVSEAVVCYLRLRGSAVRRKPVQCACCIALWFC